MCNRMRLPMAALCLLVCAAGLGAAADCNKLRACSTVIVKRGSKGSCVSAVQRIVGTTVDGDFGPKTDAAVKAYQRSKGLVVDGIVGPKTWGAIVAANCRAPAPAPASYGYFKTSKFCAGTTTPVLPAVQDVIAASIRSYGSVRTGIKDKVLARAWKSNGQAQALAAKVLYPNAAAALSHFLGQSGNDLTFSAADMVKESTHANDCFVKDINLLRAAAEALVPPGQTKCLTNTKEQTPRSASTNTCNSARGNGVSKTDRGGFDWHAAVGGYRTATQAAVTNTGGKFTALVWYTIRDFYDWDPKDTGHVGLVTPNQMYALHVWGWARDFKQSGEYQLSQSWTKGQRLAFRK